MGPLFIDLNGIELAPDEFEMLQHPLVAGVILFARNYEDRAQLTDLIRHIRSARKEPLLIVVDQEGGRVQRFRHQFTSLPAAGQLAELAESYHCDPLSFIEDMGYVMAGELRACDVDVSLAPVLDLHRGSEVIGQRAFAEDPESVIERSQAFISGMRAWSMASVGKHFPGHGSVKEDSHLAQVFDKRSFAELMEFDLKPFETLVSNQCLDAIMPAHVIYSQISDKPAGFSHTWVQEILRDTLGFNGLVFSDDLSMQAAQVAGDVTERAMMAIDAGCDLLLACNDRKASETLLDHLPRHCCHAKAQQLLPVQSGLSWEILLQDPHYQRIQSYLKG